MNNIKQFFINIYEHGDNSLLTVVCVILLVLSIMFSILIFSPILFAIIMAGGIVGRVIYAGLKGGKKNDFKFTKRNSR